jgi:hypothetical protein
VRDGHGEGDHMRRLARHLFTLCSAISLLLGATFLCLSALSYSDEDAGFLTMWPFCIRVIHENVLIYSEWIEMTRETDFSAMGVQFRGTRNSFNGGWRWMTSLPLTYVVIFSLAAPALYGIGVMRERRRIAVGLCSTCGYDLRAHRTGDRCPECGTMVEAAFEASA